jgi:hypothetical protein
MTGRNVASGVRNHATIAQRRHSVKKEDSKDNWHYVKSGEYYVETMMAVWAVRDTKYACVITSGRRNMPKNWARAGLGVGLCAADTLGRRLGSADANGVGGPTTDISHPRWREQHEHRRAPVEWSAGYIWGVDGIPADTPADIPWHLVDGMEGRADNVGLEYLEPLCYSVQPNWLTELGVKEMLETSATLGDAACVAGLDHSTQSVPVEQQPAFIAA